MRMDMFTVLFLSWENHVSPIKVMTIPRLQLKPAVVSVTVSGTLKEELECVAAEEFFWTNSMVVLGYINHRARRFHTFVANRVRKIHLHTTHKKWRYISTAENPADHSSSGLMASKLLSNWLTGPTFLRVKEILPPSVRDPEVRKALCVTHLFLVHSSFLQ